MSRPVEIDQFETPTRDVLSVVARQDQRVIRFLELIGQWVRKYLGIAFVVVNDGNDIETGEPVVIVDLEA